MPALIETGSATQNTPRFLKRKKKNTRQNKHRAEKPKTIPVRFTITLYQYTFLLNRVLPGASYDDAAGRPRRKLGENATTTELLQRELAVIIKAAVNYIIEQQSRG